MSYDLFPQPSAGDLGDPVEFWLSFNPYWWKIFQGEVERLNRADRWVDLTESIETAIIAMMVPHELTECPSPNIWVKTFDFHLNNGSWAAVAANNGSWTVNAGGWVASTSVAGTILHIKRTVPVASNVHGMSAIITIGGAGSKEVRLSLLNPSEQFIFSNLNHPAVTNTEISATSPRDNVTELRVRMSTSGNGASALLRRLTVWGEGTNPF